MIPTLEYKINNGTLSYRWANVVKGFKMPVKVLHSKNLYSFIYPTENIQQIKVSNKELKIDDNFYIYTKKL